MVVWFMMDEGGRSTLLCRAGARESEPNLKCLPRTRRLWWGDSPRKSRCRRPSRYPREPATAIERECEWERKLDRSVPRFRPTHRDVEEDRGVVHDLRVRREAGEHRQRHRLVHQARRGTLVLSATVGRVTAPEKSESLYVINNLWAKGKSS